LYEEKETSEKNYLTCGIDVEMSETFLHSNSSVMFEATVRHHGMAGPRDRSSEKNIWTYEREVMVRWINIDNEKFHTFWSSSDVIRKIKSINMSWT
jgi:hypothetical protein